MILLALGSNLPSAHGDPRETLEAAIGALAAEGVKTPRRSGWYASRPVPPAPQPDYVNGVAEIETGLAPAPLLAMLHRIEAAFGRVRGERNAARSLDLDLIDYDGRSSEPGAVPELPHPRMHERAFVLAPLVELAPDWRHPRLGLSAAALLQRLPEAERVQCRKLP
jgi:2-amino-4-hydroxy-6-hydroxymethyldihydropteridine diphosphokinase